MALWYDEMVSFSDIAEQNIIVIILINFDYNPLTSSDIYANLSHFVAMHRSLYMWYTVCMY